MPNLRSRLDKLEGSARRCDVVFALIADALSNEDAEDLMRNEIGCDSIVLHRAGTCPEGVEIQSVIDLGDLREHVARYGNKVGRPRELADIGA